MKDNQLDLFRERTIETSEGVIDFIAYTFQGIQYAFPKMTIPKDIVLEDVQDIMYCEPPLNSAKKKAIAKMYSALDKNKNQLFSDSEIHDHVDELFSEVFNTVYYNLTNETKLNKKIEIAIKFLDKRGIVLIDNQENYITLRSFADKAMCDGASYSNVISWIPKLKKCTNIDEYERSIEDFYNKYELYYEETI